MDGQNDRFTYREPDWWMDRRSWKDRQANRQSARWKTNRWTDRRSGKQMDRQTDGQTHRWTDTQMNRHTDEQTHRWTDTQMNRHTDEQTHRCSDTQMFRHTDVQTEIWTETWTDRQTNERTDSWTFWQRHSPTLHNIFIILQACLPMNKKTVSNWKKNRCNDFSQNLILRQFQIGSLQSSGNDKDRLDGPQSPVIVILKNQYIVEGPGAKVIKLFTAVIYGFS